MTKQSNIKDRHANAPQGCFSLHDGARDDNTPDAYQKGWVEFYKLRFKVTPDVLIPRPETELLVDAVLEFLKPLTIDHKPLTILDIGTGSGAIAISLASNLRGCNINIIATDISQKALNIAKQNAKLHGVEDKITFIQSDLLNVIARSKTTKQSNNRLPRPFGARNDTSVDIIVTNLPYIPTDRIAYLDSSVKDFEPFIALDGGDDGFKLYRKLFAQIVKKNWKPKLIVGEIDYTHGELATTEGQKYFPESVVEVKLDLAHLQRILIISN